MREAFLQLSPEEQADILQTCTASAMALAYYFPLIEARQAPSTKSMRLAASSHAAPLHTPGAIC